ncbi:MAG: hypothetical protein EA389_03290 [Ilumatobacter sp.]|nr:MAG: hypothetical protein EA389_03290 [Ilumatobacter sp.]
MNDDTFDLASAYLDDAVTPAERARAEADAEVMKLVGELRDLADHLRDVEPPSASARDRAVATALAEWSSPHDDRVSTIARGTRPSRSSRLLAYAAALLAVGVVGVVAVNGLRGTTDDAATSVSDEELAETFALDQTDDIGDTGEMSTTGDVAESMAEPEQSADSDDADRSTENHDAPAEDGAEAVDLVDLTGLTDAELARFAVALLTERDTADQPGQPDGPTIETDDAVTCEDVLDDVLAWATYADRDALFGISGRDAVARVVDPVDCSVLAEASLERAGD